MPYVEGKVPGFAYGLGFIQGAGEPGQAVKLVDDDLFAVNGTPADRSFGILVNRYADGEMCAVYCEGGIYETDQVVGEPTANDLLACDADTGLLKSAGEGEFPIAQTISFVAGVLRFKLLV